MIPVISLWQPYASLVFAGVKKFETRSFEYPKKYHHTRIGIHATLQSPLPLSEALKHLCWEILFDPNALPRGVVLGTVQLDYCLPTEAVYGASKADRIAGDWTPGRYAWKLWEPMLYPEPVPFKGGQGWKFAPIAHNDLFGPFDE